MLTPILSRSIWKYLLKHPYVILLSILGVSIGVAVVISVDIAKTSAQRAFELSLESVTGEATHQVIGGPLGLNETIYVEFKEEFPEFDSSPVIEGYVTLEGQTVQLLGLDFFSDTYYSRQITGISSSTLISLLLEPNAVLVAQVMGERMNISPGETINISIAGVQREILVAGFAGQTEDSTMDGVIAADIAAAQELLGKTGYIDRINLILPDDGILLTSINDWLPEGTTLISTAASNESTMNMTNAFNVNLTAMSLLALVVGMFLIYNTMTFSVLQRRGLIGSLRVLGVTRREIFTEILIEAAIIGLIGTSLGLLLGILLGQEMVKLVLRTVNDLYFVLTVSTFHLTWETIIKGLVLGIGVSLAAAFVPALEAASSPPQVARFRSVVESLAHRLLPYIALAGFLLMALSVVILFAFDRSIVAGFASLFMLVIGFALCIPGIVYHLSHNTGLVIGNRAGTLSKLAITGISGSISRTGTAIAALAVAISVVVGMGTMIESFRGTVDQWLRQTIQGDIYVSTTGDVSRRSANPLPEHIVSGVMELDGIEAIKKLKTIYVETNTGTIEVHAINPMDQSRMEYRLKKGDETLAWSSFDKGESLFVSEPYAYRHDISPGDSLLMVTDQGWQEFEVGGIYYDYSTDQGIVLMPESIYHKYWQDTSVSSLSLYLENREDKDAIMTAARNIVDDEPGVRVRDSLNIRQAGLNVFDRTFLITGVMQFLAIIVAFIGILSALMAYQLEKVKEIGVLRAMGFTPRQVWGMVSLQTGFMGTIAGVLAIPLGLVISVLLVFIINIRSFGWSMQMTISSSTIIEAFLIAVGAALLASLYPAWKMSRISPAEALREE